MENIHFCHNLLGMNVNLVLEGYLSAESMLIRVFGFCGIAWNQGLITLYLFTSSHPNLYSQTQSLNLF